MKSHTNTSNGMLRSLCGGGLVFCLSAINLFADNFTASATIDGTTTNTADVHIGFGVPNITITVTNGGQLINTGRTQIGYPNAASTNEAVVVTGSTSFWTNTTYTTVGRLSASNQLTITEGGRMWNTGGYIGGQDGDEGLAPSNNIALVTGPGSAWYNSDKLVVGQTGNRNQLIITNQALVVSDYGVIGGNPSAVAGEGGNNTAIVTGNGSIWTNLNSSLYTGITIGSQGANNHLVVADGGHVYAAYGLLGALAISTNNTVLITGNNSVLQLSQELEVGYASRDNQLTVSNGGKVINLSNANIGLTSAGASNNTVLVTGAGSVWTNGNKLSVGRSSAFNRMTIADGGRVDNTEGYIGGKDGDAADAAANSNTVVVTGPGSIWNNSSTLRIGGNTVGNSGNRLIITNGGLVVAAGNVNVGLASTGDNSLLVTAHGILETATGLSNGSGAGNTISNVAGVYQFTTASPTITPSAAGRITITDGTISYRDVSAANIFNTQIANMSFAGDNTFRLNNSSNSSVTAYTFDTGLGATNYHRLELVNGTTRWTTTGGTTIGTGGSMLASNTMATIAGTLTIHGSYVSDPSTNTYLADVTVGQSGTIAGGAGDLFDFKKSLFIHSTNQIGFNLANSAVEFSGGGMHTNAITGMNLGGGVAAYDAAFTLETNFAYGELHLGSASDQICFTCGNIPTVSSNGLYIGWLDLLGNSNLVTNLHVDTGITLYYDATDTRNAYLGGLSYALTDCDFVAAGGFLAPVIPEPSMIALVGIGGLILGRRRTGKIRNPKSEIRNKFK